MPKRVILQITGQPGAGKTEVCNHLVSAHGFTSILVSDLIREYAKPRGIELKERLDFNLAHARLLSELGQYAIPDKIVGTPSDLVCVDGMRVPAHAEKLRSYGSTIIALHCPSDVRFERARQRRAELDKSVYEDFLRDEELEYRNPDPFVQSTLTVMEMADYHIDSSQSVPQVLLAIDRIVLPLIQ